MFGKKYTDNETSSENIDDVGSSGDDEQLPAIVESESGAITDKQASDVGIHNPAAKIANAVKEEEVLVYTNSRLETESYGIAKRKLIDSLVNGVDFMAMQKLSKDKQRKRVSEATNIALRELDEPLTEAQLNLLRDQSLDELLGLGPLEPLLHDSEISDIMINTADLVYIEKNGHVYPTDVTFLDEAHLMGVIQRIVSRIGRRVDESNPMVDARLEDGSRFNAIVPPLALDGCLVSIRKFKKNKMTLKEYVGYDSMTPQMCRLLEIAGKVRLNIIISGGTGSGKTTLLNALSGHIDESERVITIEDAAEIQMHQPHVLRLETRPASTEGNGEITQRQLVKNALRMRPDRIILGEIRGDEVIDVLSAMNTGHDGSLATIHANNPRDCLARIENLVGMSGVNIDISSLRYQISSAVQLIVQLSRMRDGSRRITHIEEIIGIDDGGIITQTLFSYKAYGINDDGKMRGEFKCSGVKPEFLERAQYYDLGDELMECMGLPPTVE